MRSVMPQPCIGSSCRALSTSMSSVPCKRSVRSFATAIPFDRRRENNKRSFRLSRESRSPVAISVWELSKARSLLRQAPRVFDLAEPAKHFFVLFGDRRGFRHAEKLDVVSMGARQDHERRRAGRPATVLAVVPQGGRAWERRSDIFVGHVACVVHHVRDVARPHGSLLFGTPVLR